MNSINVQQLKSLLDLHSQLHLLDVRTPGEFNTAHIPGANLQPLDQLDCPAILKAVNTPIYVVCQSGARARKAAAQLSAAGCKDHVLVEGGTQAWIDAGFPVVRGQSNVLPLDRQLQLTIGTMVLTGVLLGHFVNHNWIWLAGFAGAGLTMAGITGLCPMRSFLAKMPWNQNKTQQASCCSMGA